MEIVDDIQTAVPQIYFIQSGDRIRCQDIDALLGKHLGYIMVDQVIVLVGTGRQNDCDRRRISCGAVCFKLFQLVQDLFPLLQETAAESGLGGIALPDRFFYKVLFDPEGIEHKPGELSLPVNICVPEKDRRVIGRPPASFRVVGIFDDKGEALHDPAHGDTGLLRIF